MSSELKRDKIVHLAQNSPFLTIDKIASQVNTTPHYVRTVLSENNISLQNLRRALALGQIENASVEGFDKLLSHLAIKYVGVSVEHLDGSSSVSQIQTGAFATNLGATNYNRLIDLCTENHLIAEWVEVIGIYLVHFKLYGFSRETRVLFYSAGQSKDVFLHKNHNHIILELKETNLTSKSKIMEKDSYK